MAELEPVESEALRQSFKNALKDDTDLTIKLECFTWRVHANVFSRKSGFFRRICNGNNWKESNERLVTLHDDDPVMFARLLQFLYNGDYLYYTTATLLPDVLLADQLLLPSIQELLASEINHPVHEENFDIGIYSSELSCPQIDLGVYNLADKYDIPSLTKFSLERCALNLLGVSVSSLSTLFAQHYPDRTRQDPKLNEVVVKWIASNFDLVRACQDEWDNGVGKWLKEDFELCTMVMGELRDIATCCICSPY